MNQKALIFGLRGPELLPQEREFFSKQQPWGFILFARNIEDPEQVKTLTAALRESVGREDAPILIDQEGGRVQRLRPPHWENYPPAADIGALYEADPSLGKRAAWLLARLIAFDLLALGVTVDCLPVLDVPTPDGHNVIGDRAYGTDPAQVSDLGASVCEGLLAGGVKPVIKHIPGHGRGTADSHFDLPVVDSSLKSLSDTDFVPFVDLNHIPMAMTAHIIYSDIDPDESASTSKEVMDTIIRGQMGYDGLVMCDDITMDALSGDLTHRTHAILDAGCDIVLHCTGKMDEMVEIAAAAKPLEGKSEQRAKIALEGVGQVDASDESQCRSEFAALMGQLQVADSRKSAPDPTDYGKTA